MMSTFRIDFFLVSGGTQIGGRRRFALLRYFRIIPQVLVIPFVCVCELPISDECNE